MPEIWRRKKGNIMTKGKPKNIPHFASLGELIDFFDSHDLGEYLNQKQETDFEVDIQKRTHVFALNEDIAEKLTKIALSKQVSPEELINSWLREKVHDA